jgi:hypothetical protein
VSRNFRKVTKGHHSALSQTTGDAIRVKNFTKLRPRLRGSDFKISTELGKRRSQLSPKTRKFGPTENTLYSLDEEYKSIPKVYENIEANNPMIFGENMEQVSYV